MTFRPVPARHPLTRMAGRGVAASFAIVTALLLAIVIGAPAVLIGGTLAWIALATVIGGPAAATVLLLAGAAVLALLLHRWTR